MGSTSIICHVWHIYPVSTKWWWYGINIHYKSCVTQISCINPVMVIWDQHPLLVICDTDILYQPSDGDMASTSIIVMCDTDIPYQPSDGDRGSTFIICHVWHRYPVSTKWWWRTYVIRIPVRHRYPVTTKWWWRSYVIRSHVWHKYPVTTKWWWYGINIHYKSCVTQISRINLVMVIWDQHPL
jgi:hypothetical protein